MVSTLHAKIALLVAGTLGVFAAVIGGGAYRSIRQQEQEAEAHAVALSRMMAQFVSVPRQTPYAHPDQILTNFLPTIFALERNLVFVVFSDEKGQPVLSHAVLPSEGGPDADERKRLGDPDYRGRADWKLVGVDIERDGKVQNRLRVGYSMAEIRRKITAQTRQLVLLTAGLAALGLTAAALLAHRFTRPLSELSEAMRRVQCGEFGSTVEARGRDEIADLARAFNEMSTELRNRERLRANFARFVSAAVADKVISENMSVKLGGERRVVTVLFADIRGFTARATRQSPEKVVGMLNECFRTLVDVIPRYGGTLDKFIGDGLMAVFNAPTELPVHEVCALMAALDMQRAIRSLNERRRAAGEEPLDLGIGINTGEAVAGTFGSERRLEYTVIGAAVNLAQRIEDHALGGELLLGETTYRAVRHLVEAESLPPVRFKGLESPVPVYKVLDLIAAVRDAGNEPAPAVQAGS